MHTIFSKATGGLTMKNQISKSSSTKKAKEYFDIEIPFSEESLTAELYEKHSNDLVCEASMEAYGFTQERTIRKKEEKN